MKFITPEFSTNSLLFLQHSDVRFGVAADGKWISTANNKINAITPPDSIQSLLPILELDRSFVHNNLLQIQAENPSFPHIDTSFPEADLLEAAIIKSVSEYWPQKALNWIEGDQNLTLTLHKSIELLYLKEWASQNFKHRCKKILKSINLATN